MNMHFHKYHGTGNDFIIIDNRTAGILLSREHVAALCHRRFGIGADGLMLLENVEGADFKMVYYNSDGGESTMCGNGGRCIVAFARTLGIIESEADFIAVDGAHHASIDEHGLISLHMKDVSDIQQNEDHALLDTGSPHYVQWVEDIDDVDVCGYGRRIRYEHQFEPDGINVNFVQRASEKAINVRTYERGVENETLSCGTGVTAAAIAATGEATGEFSTMVFTPGGRLAVSFGKASATTAHSIVLRGAAVLVYEGEIDLAAV